MEHIVQIGVCVDDDSIKKAVVESATKAITKEMKEHIFSYYGGSLTYEAEKIVKDAIEQWKPEIIEKAAELVADSMKRSKIYKEKLREITNE